MKSLILPVIALGLSSTQAEAGFWKHFFRASRPQYIITSPVVHQPAIPCYHCQTPVYEVYQPVIYRQVKRKPHFGFSFGSHGAGFSFWS